MKTLVPNFHRNNVNINISYLICQQLTDVTISKNGKGKRCEYYRHS